MSLYGVLRTGVSGMTAQSTKFGTIADNIANTGTTGYKRASVQFSALLLESSAQAYNSGAVSTSIRHSVTEQGPLVYTSSATDLAIEGSGFMLVADANGTPFLTRAGSFVTDAATANLVNTGGYTLLGYPLDEGNPSAVLNGVSNLEPINMTDKNLQARPSTGGVFSVNLPANEPLVTGDTPSENLVTSAYTVKSSIVAYDNIGNEVTLDVYMTKTSETPFEWEVSIFDQSAAAPGGGFPYTSGPLASQVMAFDEFGALVSTTTIPVPTTEGTFEVQLPAGEAVVSGDTPFDNLGTSTFSYMETVTAYDNAGDPVLLDVYMTKTNDTPFEWEVTVFDQSAGSPGFPYTGGSLVSSTLSFTAGGALSGSGVVSIPVPGGATFDLDFASSTQLAAAYDLGDVEVNGTALATTAGGVVSIPVPDGATLDLDFGSTTQLATAYTPLNVEVNGNAPSAISGIVIDFDGTVFASFENGSRLAVYRIPLATVQSPDNLRSEPGDAFSVTSSSGDIQIGFPNEGGRGSLAGGSLEQSNVDMASELTEMIVAQRDYQANSKIVQTSSELLEVLMNLKR
jgi:flagellar hook protein FlgE